MTNIVMVVKDRWRLTEQALESLVQNTPAELYTLTLVDDASQDFRTRRLLARFASAANVSLLRIETSAGVVARAKNIGVAWSQQSFARGEWLYLSDNDVLFHPGWLPTLGVCARLSECFGYTLWGGQVHPFHHPLDSTYMSGPNGCVLKEHGVLDGPSWLMRWRTWKELRGLRRNCAPGTGQSEDAEFCARLRSRGGRIGVVVPHVVIHTGVTNTSGEPIVGAELFPRVLGVLYE